MNKSIFSNHKSKEDDILLFDNLNDICKELNIEKTTLIELNFDEFTELIDFEENIIKLKTLFKQYKEERIINMDKILNYDKIIFKKNNDIENKNIYFNLVNKKYKNLIDDLDKINKGNELEKKLNEKYEIKKKIIDKKIMNIKQQNEIINNNIIQKKNYKKNFEQNILNKNKNFISKKEEIFNKNCNKIKEDEIKKLLENKKNFNKNMKIIKKNLKNKSKEKQKINEIIENKLITEDSRTKEIIHKKYNDIKESINYKLFLSKNNQVKNYKKIKLKINSELNNHYEIKIEKINKSVLLKEQIDNEIINKKKSYLFYNNHKISNNKNYINYNYNNKLKQIEYELNNKLDNCDIRYERYKENYKSKINNNIEKYEKNKSLAHQNIIFKNNEYENVKKEIILKDKNKLKLIKLLNQQKIEKNNHKIESNSLNFEKNINIKYQLNKSFFYQKMKVYNTIKLKNERSTYLKNKKNNKVEINKFNNKNNISYKINALKIIDKIDKNPHNKKKYEKILKSINY